MTRHFDFEARNVRGDELDAKQRAEALARYINRYTLDNRPAWSRREWQDGKTYPVQFASDAEWLANTRFNVDRNGKLLDRDCYTTGQTYPRNPELRKA